MDKQYNTTKNHREHLQIQSDKDCQHLPEGAKWNSARPLRLHGVLGWPHTAQKEIETNT